MKYTLMILFTLSVWAVHAQQIGTEQLATKTFYKGDFKVEGDKRGVKVI